MSSGVALVMMSKLDTDTLLPLMRQALGRNIAAGPDAAGVEPPLHHLLCLASIKEVAKSASAAKPYLNLFHAGFIIAADERDFAEVLEVAGLPSILVDSQQRGIKVAFIAGTVARWREAIIRGSVAATSKDVRVIYNQVYSCLSKLGLSPALDLYVSAERPDKTFLIEHKR